MMVTAVIGNLTVLILCATRITFGRRRYILKKRKRSGQALLFTLLCEIKKEVERAKEANLENLSPESEQQFVKSYRFILDEGFELNREKDIYNAPRKLDM
jgi:hypothetical protein